MANFFPEQFRFETNPSPVITLDYQRATRLFVALIRSVAGKEAIQVSDLCIKTRVPEAEWGQHVINGKIVDVEGGLALGIKLIDLVCYSMVPDEQKPAIVIDNTVEEGPRDILTVASSLFKVYLYLLLRGTYPDGKEGNQDPGFVARISSAKSAYICMGELCSFGMPKYGTSWIRHIPLNELDSMTKSRMSLGMAGYRYVNALFSRPIPVDLPVDIAAVMTAIEEFVIRGPRWCVHPCTKSDDFTNKYGNFNRNMTNLIYEVHGEDAVRQMKEEQLLPAAANRSRARDYLTWPVKLVEFRTVEDFILERDEPFFNIRRADTAARAVEPAFQQAPADNAPRAGADLAGRLNQ